MTRRGKKIVVRLVIVAVLLGIGAFVFLRWAKPHYDELVGLREVVRKEWAQIDIQLQRRYDLLPNLLATVKAVAGYEAKVLTEIADAHTGYMKARGMTSRIKAAYRAERGVRTLIAWGTRYPQLRATAAFIKLMSSLERTEDLIAKQRMAYNSAVAKLNTKAESMTGLLVRRVAGVETAPYYNPPAQVIQVPKLNFSAKSGGAGGAGNPKSKGKRTLDKLVIKGMVRQRGRPVGAVVQYSTGESVTLRVGARLRDLGATVVAISDKGIKFEVRSKKKDGTSRLTTVFVGR